MEFLGDLIGGIRWALMTSTHTKQAGWLCGLALPETPDSGPTPLGPPCRTLPGRGSFRNNSDMLRVLRSDPHFTLWSQARAAKGREPKTQVYRRWPVIRRPAETVEPAREAGKASFSDTSRQCSVECRCFKPRAKSRHWLCAQCVSFSKLLPESASLQLLYCGCP